MASLLLLPTTTRTTDVDNTIDDEKDDNESDYGIMNRRNRRRVNVSASSSSSSSRRGRTKMRRMVVLVPLTSNNNNNCFLLTLLFSVVYVTMILLGNTNNNNSNNHGVAVVEAFSSSQQHQHQHQHQHQQGIDFGFVSRQSPLFTLLSRSVGSRRSTGSTTTSSSSSRTNFLFPSTYSTSTSTSLSFHRKTNNHNKNNNIFGSHSRRRRLLVSSSTTRLLSTTATNNSLEDEEEDSNNNNEKTGNIFQQALRKFQARPRTYLLIPIIAALVGYVTNYLAVQMIFYPIQFRGLKLWTRPEIPLGLLGWQGIVPCKTKTMSAALVEMVTSQLLSVQDAFDRLDPRTIATLLTSKEQAVVQELGTAVIKDVAVVGGRTTVKGTKLIRLFTTLTHPKRLYSGIVRFFETRIITNMMKELLSKSTSIFNLKNCVIDQMILDRAKLGQLFQKVGSVELKFLVNSGVWFGFLLGVIQMLIALVWSNPWSLSLGGMVVGLATNWLALKWIFEPVYPTKMGPFVIQGMFLKRQKEVAMEFSKFFANNIITSKQIWNTILTDPTTKPSLFVILYKHISRFLKPFTSIGVMEKVASSTISNLQQHLPLALHRYIDTTLKLETTLRTQMELMSPAKFERVLHPIFEQDELTLIIAGGVLGFGAGLIQQFIEHPDSVTGVYHNIKARVRQFNATLQKGIQGMSKRTTNNTSSNTITTTTKYKNDDDTDVIDIEPDTSDSMESDNGNSNGNGTNDVNDNGNDDGNGDSNDDDDDSDSNDNGVSGDKNKQ